MIKPNLFYFERRLIHEIFKKFYFSYFQFLLYDHTSFCKCSWCGWVNGKGSLTNGIVSVSHPLAAEAGIEILKQGGNAVDAAAAIQLSLNVVEPMMSGIGGGGFIMIYNKKENKITMIENREMAPQNVTPKLFLDEKENLFLLVSGIHPGKRLLFLELL